MTNARVPMYNNEVATTYIRLRISRVGTRAPAVPSEALLFFGIEDFPSSV